VIPNIESMTPAIAMALEVPLVRPFRGVFSSFLIAAPSAPPINDVACGHLLAAQQGVPDSDTMRKTVLDAWRTTRLHCDGHLKAAPVLTPSAASKKVADGRGAQGRGGGA
jgi:hypothetical protein